MNRRKFLKLTGLAIAGVAVGVPGPTVIESIDPLYSTAVIDTEGLKYMTVMVRGWVSKEEYLKAIHKYRKSPL